MNSRSSSLPMREQFPAGKEKRAQQDFSVNGSHYLQSVISSLVKSSSGMNPVPSGGPRVGIKFPE